MPKSIRQALSDDVQEEAVVRSQLSHIAVL